MFFFGKPCSDGLSKYLLPDEPTIPMTADWAKLMGHPVVPKALPTYDLVNKLLLLQEVVEDPANKTSIKDLGNTCKCGPSCRVMGQCEGPSEGRSGRRETRHIQEISQNRNIQEHYTNTSS